MNLVYCLLCPLAVLAVNLRSMMGDKRVNGLMLMGVEKIYKLFVFYRLTSFQLLYTICLQYHAWLSFPLISCVAPGVNTVGRYGLPTLT